MSTEVHNITDVLPGHAHPGAASYSAYAQGCRNFDCLNAFQEYKLRLAERKLSGEYVDRRLREHRPAEITELRLGPLGSASGPQGIALEPGPQEAVVDTDASRALPEGSSDTPDGHAVTGDLSATAERVREYLELVVIPGTEGKLNPTLLAVLPTVLQMPGEVAQAAMDELENAGELAGDGEHLVLVPAGARTA
jgi:hypothetical protein